MWGGWKKKWKKNSKISLVDYVVAIHFWQLDKCSRIYRNHSQLYYLLHIIYILNFIPWGSYTSPSRGWLNRLSVSLVLMFSFFIWVSLVIYRIIYNTHIRNNNKKNTKRVFANFCGRKKNEIRNLYMKGTPTFICC